MPKITYINAQGNPQTIEAPTGQSLMQVATNQGLKGIVAECGGSAMCATCHVYVEPAWLDKIPAANSTELEMLECTASERTAQSRLSCQIRITDDLDGMVVTLPASQ
jgi:ferredoxin, 2Fe-2S